MNDTPARPTTGRRSAPALPRRAAAAGRSDRRGERGAALLEFMFVAVIFMLLLVGMLTYGLLLSFDQDITRAASEGARAGAVAVSDAEGAAEAAVDQAVAAFGQECGVGALTCTIAQGDCGDAVPDPVDDPTTDNCVTVEVVYDYDADPILPKLPILSAAYPSRVAASSVSEMNPTATTTTTTP